MSRLDRAAIINKKHHIVGEPTSGESEVKKTAVVCVCVCVCVLEFRRHACITKRSTESHVLFITVV